MNNFIEIRQIDRDNVNYLVRNLENFEKDKAVRIGLRSAGNVFRVEGKRKLRNRMKSGKKGVTGNLLRSFQVKVKQRKLGVITGFRTGKDGGNHVWLIDLGTGYRHQRQRKNKSVGRVTPNNFWSDTESQDHPKAIDKLYEGIEKAVTRISNRR